VNQASPAATYANIALWRAASTYDKHSVSYRPGYISNTNIQPNPADSASWSINGHGVHITGNATDINGNARPVSITQGAPDLGAYEFTPASVPPMAIASAAPSAGSTQAFLFAGDTVATIAWDPYYSVPSGVEVRRYSGVRPPAIDTTANNYMYHYTYVNAAPGYYNYTLNLYYKHTWDGTTPSETNLRLAKRDTTGYYPWYAYTGTTSSVDTIRGIISAAGLYDFTYNFTGTDNSNPLPVVLLGNITAKQMNQHVLINWATASEINSDRFDVQVSKDAVQFTTIGSRKAAGESNRVLTYDWLHTDAFTNYTGTLYYRIKMVDRDASFAYSNVVAVTPGSQHKTLVITAVPNPFGNATRLNISSEKGGDAELTITDITGKLVMQQSVQLNKGYTMIDLDKLASENDGMLFVNVNVNGEIGSLKLLKASR
jgi:hypothetical protein